MAANGVPYPLINGVRHSWSSIEIRAAGVIVLGIFELNYAPALEPGLVRGAGARPIAMTLGEGSHECDFSILLEEFNTLVTGLGSAWMTKPFTITASYSEEGSGLTTIVDTITGRLTKVEASNSASSTDGSARKCTFKPITMLLNGVDPLPPFPSLTA